MIERFRTFMKRIVPVPAMRETPRHRSRTHRADIAEAWEFKRDFFWTAFKALDFNGIDGDYVEFGSHGGRTFRLAFDEILRRRRSPRHMWAFDSFQGLPDAAEAMDSHPEWRQGAMATDIASFHKICKSHRIPDDTYTVVQGYYEETLPRMSDDAAPTNIALAYIDCDLYSSTKTVLEFLAPRLKHGMIVAFDDYFCWSADQVSGESKALAEFMARDETWNFVRYRDYGWAATSFLVERADG